MTGRVIITLSLDAVKQRLAEQIVEDGGYFRPCAYCGCTYPLPQADWTNETVCGPRCHDDYVAYLNNPDAW